MGSSGGPCSRTATPSTSLPEPDARTLVTAVSIYSAQMGTLPAALIALNSVATNSMGQTAGPFMASTPAPPAGWTAYGYTSTAGGTFTVSTSGDATTVSLP